MNNRKKYLIALIAFVVCSAMFFFASKAERMYANNTTKQESKAADTKNTSKSSEEVKKTADEKNTSNSTANDASKNIPNAATNSSQKLSPAASQENKSPNNSSSGSGQTTTAAQASTAKQNTETANPKEEPTFMFIDAVHGENVILQIRNIITVVVILFL